MYVWLKNSPGDLHKPGPVLYHYGQHFHGIHSKKYIYFCSFCNAATLRCSLLFDTSNITIDVFHSFDNSQKIRTRLKQAAVRVGIYDRAYEAKLKDKEKYAYEENLYVWAVRTAKIVCKFPGEARVIYPNKKKIAKHIRKMEKSKPRGDRLKKPQRLERALKIQRCLSSNNGGIEIMKEALSPEKFLSMTSCKYKVSSETNEAFY
ncbi:hypothetical protein RF11_11565 [Thelohanellus kitauei]|uniref:Uncharacterized protein n=1 Tax=Thelohanellus kitauei TaxID=669202 RepID=A0A0C2MDF9_THEKT|nr:hypothetical protein RF11_11565 [Thelohanellus kitauei]